MLSIIHKNAYQDFLKLLNQWKTTVTSFNFDSKTTIDEENWQNLQRAFKEEILAITDDNMDVATASNWISIQAEIQREFRLLVTDWIFLKTARQEATVKARKQTLIQRLEKLVRFCQKMSELAD